MTTLKLKSALKSGVSYLEDVYGGAAIIMALMTPIIIGGLAFGAEVGGWELTKRQVQNAADTAAYAAATQVRSGMESDVVAAAAFAVAEVSGYKGGEDGVLVENPPSTAPDAADGTDPNGDASYVYVTLSQTANRNFTKFFAANNSITIQSAALAHVQNGRPACVLALAPATSGAVTATGSTDVTLSGCDVAANSISSTAVTVSGSADITTDCVSAVGGVSASSGLVMTECSEAIENAPITADPYRYMAEPTVPATCASASELNKFLTNNTQTRNPKPSLGPPSAINAAYCGGGNIHGTTQLDAGVYVLKGGVWKVNSTATLTGSGVTLYLACNGPSDCATLDINGGATINLSAPLTGTYKGIVIYFARNNNGSSVINGGSNFDLAGAVYGVKQNISFSGSTTGSGPGKCSQVIGYTVQFTGNSDFNTDCSASGTTSIVTAQSIKIVG